jgi:hypothetical protein
MYFDTEKKACTEKALQALKQTKKVAAYTHMFMTHAHDCGWEARTLVSQYMQGLHKDVRLALVLARTLFETLAEVSQLSLKINNKIHGANASQPNPSTPTNPDARDISALSGQMLDTERARMMRMGLCFQCGEQVHLSRDFPSKPPQGLGKGKGKFKLMNWRWK